MPLIERYILRRMSHVFLLTLGALVGTLWVVQVLRELDIVTAQGRTIWVFFLLRLLALPSLVQVIAPIAIIAAAVGALDRLAKDSELPVIAAAGASRFTVARPVLVLAASIMLIVSALSHVISPASLSLARSVLSQAQAAMIAVLVQDGGFRNVQYNLTMHIGEKLADGSFRDIFISDERDPEESIQYLAERGVLMQQLGSSFLVLQRGNLIRQERQSRDSTVVAFETYALDFSQIMGPGGDPRRRPLERSTSYLLAPAPDDPILSEHPEQAVIEVHDRMTAPLYALAFALIALAFMGSPRTSRQDRSFSITAAVLLCVLLRVAGMAAFQSARSSEIAVAFMYVIPLGGIAFGAYATARGRGLRVPRRLEWLVEAALGSGAAARRVWRRTRIAAAGRT